MIKFRAWDKEEKEWLSIRTIGFDDDGSLWYLQAWDENENDIDPPYLEDDLGVKWELLQSTGLFDLDGNEIYIGDILKIEDEYTQVVFHEDNTTYGIYLEDKEGGGNPISDYSTRISLNHINGNIEGNIYQHPHLLEE
ncbi:hypothetical protein JWK44_08920 [Staphylococcus saprophyticus]|uniref:YopX family protein n=1 Tax=Staphylococcus saprophyticus TaxID=29385 RepID=UPI001A8E0939|nr:YopX family protein [Staphylococcus saprophyticus]MBO0382638.1 hypothetical protein [Staphylococcus saprophyticus]